MKNQRLTRSFYTRPTLEVAKELLGKYLVRPIRKSWISNGVKKIATKKLIGRIVEVEAYIGPEDKASHAFRGKVTPRNLAEYFIGGHIYIYLVYGMYWQLNISTHKEGKPECVLIRALDLGKLADGPGKLCRYLKLNKSFYGEDLTKSKRIWLEDPAPRRVRGKQVWSKVPESQIKKTARIGIDYAGPYWARRKWRFYIK